MAPASGRELALFCDRAVSLLQLCGGLRFYAATFAAVVNEDLTLTPFRNGW
jgi:hypothetical protein